MSGKSQSRSDRSQNKPAISLKRQLPPIPDLGEHVQRLVRQVPSGRLTTPGILAEALGNKIAARWVGHWLVHHAHEGDCPCHRVVRTTGEVGTGVFGSVEGKARLLVMEGHAVDGGVVDSHPPWFVRFNSNQPLQILANWQRRWQEQIKLMPLPSPPRLVAGVDVSYDSSSQRCAAAYALCDAKSWKLLWHTTVTLRTTFPYISSYLSFRELPPLLELIDLVRSRGRLADVVMVDGSGILHPRGAGIASHLGVLAGSPTIGVTKKLLCGVYDRDALLPGRSVPVRHEQRVRGTAVLPPTGTRRPLFVSPGDAVTVRKATSLVKRSLRRRLPEPIYWADRLSRQSLKQ